MPFCYLLWMFEKSVDWRCYAERGGDCYAKLCWWGWRSSGV